MGVIKLQECKRCGLHKTRTQVVAGIGPLTAKVMLVGQNPGREEDEQGKPFVGRSGKEVDKGLAIVGLKRSEIRITNAVKCLTPNNRVPGTDELDACFPWLAKEIKRIKPRFIITFGNPALTQLTGYTGITSWRGKLIINTFTQPESYIFPMFHPAAVLRPSAPDERGFTRRDYWDQDWVEIKRLIGDANKRGWEEVFSINGIHGNQGKIPIIKREYW